MSLLIFLPHERNNSLPTVSITGLFRGKGDRIMSILLWISGIVTLVLLIYLFVALLKPEKFQ